MATLYTPDGDTQEIIRAARLTLADIRELIGAEDTALPVELGSGLKLWYDEDGRYCGKQINHLATDLAYGKNRLRRYEFMVGKCLLTKNTEIRL